MNPEPQKRIWNLVHSGTRGGRVILWLHGFMGSHADWAGLVHDHFKDYHNILADLPGHGSSKLSGHENFPACANDLFHQLTRAGIDRLSIVGYSMGGRFGLHFQKRYPCHIDSLVGLSTGPGLRSEEERQKRVRSDEALIQEMQTIGMKAFLIKWYASPLFQCMNNNSELLKRLIRERRQNDPSQLQQSLGLLGNGALYSLWEHLPSMELPVLLLSGELDSKYNRINEEMLALLPRGQHTIIEQGDHAFHLEKPLETAILIRNFLRNLNKGE